MQFLAAIYRKALEDIVGTLAAILVKDARVDVQWT